MITAPLRSAPSPRSDPEPAALSRRAALRLGACALAGAAAPGAAARADFLDASDWARFKARFVTPEGRVVDTGNGGRSHSEGQGYGMLLAVAHDDADTFLRLWRWTRETLQTRDDALLSWLWTPEAGRVTDPNNASDAELLVAWALFRAHGRWGEPAWAAAAEEMLAALAERCVVEHRGAPLLLPGVEGFRAEDHVIVNPSYWVFPALSDFAHRGVAGPWAALFGSGEALLDAFAATGRGLPPDWCAVGETIGPAPDKSFAFGFDAIRAPLYLRWATPSARALSRLRPVAEHARAFRGAAATPATIDLQTGAVASYPMSLGGQAILLVAESAVTGAPLALPAWREDLDYYAAVLLLLSKLAASEMHS